PIWSARPWLRSPDHSHHKFRARFALAANGRDVLESTRKFEPALGALADVVLQIGAFEIGEALARMDDQRPVLCHHRCADHPFRRNGGSMDLDGLHALPPPELGKLAGWKEKKLPFGGRRGDEVRLHILYALR